jgi:hypothetical protein
MNKESEAERSFSEAVKNQSKTLLKCDYCHQHFKPEDELFNAPVGGWTHKDCDPRWKAIVEQREKYQCDAEPHLSWCPAKIAEEMENKLDSIEQEAKADYQDMSDRADAEFFEQERQLSMNILAETNAPMREWLRERSSGHRFNCDRCGELPHWSQARYHYSGECRPDDAPATEAVEQAPQLDCHWCCGWRGEHELGCPEGPTPKPPAAPALSLLIIDLGDSCVVKVDRNHTDCDILEVPWIGHSMSDVKDNDYKTQMSMKIGGWHMLNSTYLKDVKAAIDAQFVVEPPVPRIEFESGERRYYLHYDREGMGLSRRSFTEEAYASLSLLAGHPLPIYDPATVSKGVWTQLAGSLVDLDSEYPTNEIGVEAIWRFEVK